MGYNLNTILTSFLYVRCVIGVDDVHHCRPFQIATSQVSATGSHDPKSNVRSSLFSKLSSNRLTKFRITLANAKPLLAYACSIQKIFPREQPEENN